MMKIPTVRHMCVTATLITIVTLIVSIAIMSSVTYYKTSDLNSKTSVSFTLVDSGFGKTIRMYQVIALAFAVLLLGVHYYHRMGPMISTGFMMVFSILVLVFSALTMAKMQQIDPDNTGIKDNSERSGIKAMIYISSAMGILAFLACGVHCLNYMLMRMKVT